MGDYDEIVSEFSLGDVNQEDPTHKGLLGVITKLRGKNRDLSAKLQDTTSQFESAGKELETYKRREKQSEIITSVLGDKKHIPDMDKFNKWANKLAGSETWEADLKELVTDFAIDKPADTKPEDKGTGKGEDKKPDPADTTKPDPAKGEEKKPDDNKPAGDPPKEGQRYTPRRSQGVAGSVKGTEVIAPRTPSERLRMAKEDPEAYAQWRSENGRK